jgi:hypothetical protein
MGDGATVRDPNAPPPWRSFDLGRETARILRDSPWRVALVATSSWSRVFLTEKHRWVLWGALITSAGKGQVA